MKKSTNEINLLSLNQAVFDGSCIMGMNFDGNAHIFFKGNAKMTLHCSNEDYNVFRDKWKKLAKINYLKHFEKNYPKYSARFYINRMI